MEARLAECAAHLFAHDVAVKEVGGHPGRQVDRIEEGTEQGLILLRAEVIILERLEPSTAVAGPGIGVVGNGVRRVGQEQVGRGAVQQRLRGGRGGGVGAHQAVVAQCVDVARLHEDVSGCWLVRRFVGVYEAGHRAANRQSGVRRDRLDQLGERAFPGVDLLQQRVECCGVRHGEACDRVERREDEAFLFLAKVDIDRRQRVLTSLTSQFQSAVPVDDSPCPDVDDDLLDQAN